MQYSIRYFTGTGNTKDAVSEIRGILEAAGHACGEVDIAAASVASSSNREAPDVAASNFDALIVAFPVYAWAPPALVMRYLRSLPKGAGRPAAVAAVDGGGGARGARTAARALARRGYDVRQSARIGYPDNWSQIVPPRSDVEPRVESGRSEARALAERIRDGQATHYVPAGAKGLLLSAIGALFRVLGRRMLGRLYVADDSCTSCKLCERTCPVGAIVMDSAVADAQSRPRWRASCESCNRCINICPEGSINTSWLRLILMVPLIAGLSIGLVRLFDVAVWNGLDDAFLGSLAWVRPIVIVALVAVAHVIYLALNRAMFRIEHLHPLRRLTYASFTRNAGRYVMSGYRPTRLR